MLIQSRRLLRERSRACSCTDPVARSSVFPELIGHSFPELSIGLACNRHAARNSQFQSKASGGSFPLSLSLSSSFFACIVSFLFFFSFYFRPPARHCHELQSLSDVAWCGRNSLWRGNFFIGQTRSIPAVYQLSDASMFVNFFFGANGIADSVYLHL